ncbi:MAG: FecCD family ABC transporter permease [Fusobacteriaceae bacterium]
MKKIFMNYKWLFLILCVTLLICSTYVVTIGAVSLKGVDVWKIIINKTTGKTIFNKEWKDSIEIIVWNLRVPRILMGIVSGGGLALVGILMQCLTKNPLASPYILGISAGASTGAVMGLLFLGGTMFTVPLGAFIFGTLTALMVFYFAGAGGFSSARLVLIGVAVSSLFSGITTLMIMMAPNEKSLRSAMFWMSGSLSGATWEYIPLAVISLVIAVVLIYPRYRELNILVTGDENAVALGVNVKKIRILTMLVATFLTGIIVSNTGIIGFVGLVIPHIVRGIVGGNHKKNIPCSIVMGAIFLIITDTIARSIYPLQEIPIGVITSIIGAPFFLNMLRKKSYSFGGE